MTEGEPKLGLSDTFRRLADAYRPKTWESFDFTSIDRADGVVTAVLNQLRYRTPAARPAGARRTPAVPAGREVVYVIRTEPHHGYGDDGDALQVTLATRPAPGGAAGGPAPSADRRKPAAAGRTYRSLVGGLAASADPHDREVADKFLLAALSGDRYGSRQPNEFSLPVAQSADLLAASRSRAGCSATSTTPCTTTSRRPAGWLGDDRFELKFELAPTGKSHLRRGVCAVSPSATVPHGQLDAVAAHYFFDKAGRLGLFRAAAPAAVVRTATAGRPVVVPRDRAGELVEQPMREPTGKGVEFVDCDDVRPPRVTTTPRPRIHLRAPSAAASTVEADAHFDYDAVPVGLDTAGGEFYDAGRRVLIAIDAAAHDRARQLLADLGVKVRHHHDSPRLAVPKLKLPEVIATLIRHGWHVDAEGKLYRAGTGFKLDVVNGIDWFELQGTATFDQASVGLPALLAAVRGGQQTVVLDDGSLGMIPAEWAEWAKWAAQFGGPADLAGGQADGDSLRFGRSQVGLLDTLLAQQPQANVDGQFTAARDALRAFDRVQPLDPPAGFVGTLRPYQQLALGWFAFLRTLWFGGCLADDMGLGKTVQVLALLQQRRLDKAGPSLIVVPRSLVFNWGAEAAKFAPDLRSTFALMRPASRRAPAS